MSSHPTLRCLALAAGVFGASLAQAGTVDWTSWTNASGSSVAGSVTAGASTVGVTFSGPYSFAQTNNSGTDYWLPATPYLSTEVANAPVTSDIIGLNNAGTFTISFSQAVVNPLIALVSWNGANVTFGGNGDTQTYNAQYLSSGCGYWGCGSFTNTTSTSFMGTGELHGVVELLGTYTSISFTDSVSENWHGLTIGFEGLPASVPEPGNAPLVLAGLGVLGLLLRRRASN